MEREAKWERILTLISEGKSVNSICQKLRLNHQQLYFEMSMISKILKKEFNKIYFENGNIGFQNFNDHNLRIYLDSKKAEKRTFSIVAVSDEHKGHRNSNPLYMDEVFNFCIQNNIHTILNLGDFFHGIYKNNKNDYKEERQMNPYNQIYSGLQTYPFDPNILTYLVLGNHDMSFTKEYNINLKNIITTQRQDIIVAGEIIGRIFVGSNKFMLRHISQKLVKQNSSIFFGGHSHRYKIMCNEHGIQIHVPSISTVPTNFNVPFASFLKLTFSMEQMVIKKVSVEQFGFLNDCNIPIRISECCINLDNIYRPLVKDYCQREVPYLYNQYEHSAKTYNKNKF